MMNEGDRDLLLISVFTFFTVSLWITFEVIKTIKTTTISSETQQIVVPLNPVIDKDTINKLSNRKEF